MATAKQDLSNPQVQGHREPGQRILVPTEAAELLRVSIGQLYHLTSKKKIPFTKVGGALRFDRNQLLDFIANGASAADDERSLGSRNAATRGSNGTGRNGGSTSDRKFSFKTSPRPRGAREK